MNPACLLATFSADAMTVFKCQLKDSSERENQPKNEDQRRSSHGSTTTHLPVEDHFIKFTGASSFGHPGIGGFREDSENGPV